jgi:hypothetical protein
MRASGEPARARRTFQHFKLWQQLLGTHPAADGRWPLSAGLETSAPTKRPHLPAPTEWGPLDCSRAAVQLVKKGGSPARRERHAPWPGGMVRGAPEF